MKYFIIIFLFHLNIKAQNNNVDWAPTGAKWWYTVKHTEFGSQGPVEYKPMIMESIGDTVIKNKTCKILLKSDLNCSDNQDTSYIYAENDTVFWYISTIDSFTVLYDFSITGDGAWQTLTQNYGYTDTCQLNVEVDNVSSEIINGIILKSLIKNNSKIVEKLGVVGEQFTSSSFFPLPSCVVDGTVEDCSDSWIVGLRCYEDNEIGLYQRWDSIPCDTSFIINTVSVNENNKNTFIRTYPNPIDDYLIVEMECIFETRRMYSIYDILGRHIMSGHIECGTQKIFAKSLKEGVYVIQLTTEDKPSYNYSFIKK